MNIPKTDFTKEKKLMPDGRYLIYYDFEPGVKPETRPKSEQDQINQTKGVNNV